MKRWPLQMHLNKLVTTAGQCISTRKVKFHKSDIFLKKYFLFGLLKKLFSQQNATSDSFDGFCHKLYMNLLLMSKKLYIVFQRTKGIQQEVSRKSEDRSYSPQLQSEILEKRLKSAERLSWKSKT